MKKIQKIGLILLLFALGFSSCSDSYLETSPTGSTGTATIFETTENAKMAVNGIAKLMVAQYLSIQTHCGEGTIKFLWNEYTGENFTRPHLTGWSTVMNATYTESDASTYNAYAWYYYYQLIGNANTIIGAIDDAKGPETEREFIKAQALTYRAYCYTMLVQLYCYRWVDSNNGASLTNLKDGLILRTEENADEKDLSLVSSGEIYTQIYKDLDEALRLYTSSGLSRNNVWEPNANVAYAVYARAAITRQDYSTALSMAKSARAGYSLMTNSEYFAGFSAPNSEWIWGSYGGDDQTLHYYGFHSYMAYDANTSIVRSYPVGISKTLYEKLPATDVRRDLFLDPIARGYTYSKTNGQLSTADAKTVRAEHPTMLSSHTVIAYHSFKFGIDGSRGVGYINHFRSAEMYLIEAEANYFLNKEGDAQTALNTLNEKRDASYSCTATGADLLAEIKFYRAFELWGEGFDWFDKKRYNDPIVRKSFADGGSFATAMAKDRAVDEGNRWTYVTPLIEKQYNAALTAE